MAYFVINQKNTKTGRAIWAKADEEIPFDAHPELSEKLSTCSKHLLHQTPYGYELVHKTSEKSLKKELKSWFIRENTLDQAPENLVSFIQGNPEFHSRPFKFIA